MVYNSSTAIINIYYTAKPRKVISLNKTGFCRARIQSGETPALPIGKRRLIIKALSSQ